MSLSVALLHAGMHDKTGKIVTTSLTMIDLHDISRSCKTYGVEHFYIAHPSASMRALAGSLKNHWDTGFGSTYNPDRKEALDITVITESLDAALTHSESVRSRLPCIIGTSAIDSSDRLKFTDCKNMLAEAEGQDYLLLLGTGWGMADQLIERCDYFLEPIKAGQDTGYNHLSVRSALAIMLDRLLG